MELKDFFKQNPCVALGFSGGVDSAYLLYAAVKYAERVKAYYVKTAFQPAFELEDAKKLAEQLKADMEVITLDILAESEVCENPNNRCYYCKQNIFGAIVKKAKEDSFKVILDGSNASDDAGDRPGMVALSELSVKSPLRECGLTKSKIRELSKEAGLFTWDKPAYACLATRVSTGTIITDKILKTTEAGEEALRSMGFKDFRIRYMDGAARIQLTEEDLLKALNCREEIIQRLSPFYNSVLLDLSTVRRKDS